MRFLLGCGRAPSDICRSRLFRGQRAVDLGAVLKKKIRPALEGLGLGRVGWHTFRHTVGTLLAEMGEHQLTIRDYLRHSNLSVTEQVFASHVGHETKGAGEVVEAILPVQLRVMTRTESLAP